MSRFFLELELDALCWEFLARRIVTLQRPLIIHDDMPIEDDLAFGVWHAEFLRINGLPQPVIAALDGPTDDDPDWDELTAREQLLGKMRI